MIANEVTDFAYSQASKIHRYGVISILSISPPKVIYAEGFCVKDTPLFFSKLISESPVLLYHYVTYYVI
jgi:hypothetical protein